MEPQDSFVYPIARTAACSSSLNSAKSLSSDSGTSSLSHSFSVYPSVANEARISAGSSSQSAEMRID